MGTLVLAAWSTKTMKFGFTSSQTTRLTRLLRGSLFGNVFGLVPLVIQRLFSSGASPSVDNNVAQLVFEPDGYIRPLGKATPGGANDLTANVIVEVAFSEPEPHVLAKAAAWIGPGFTVQQVIVIKIGARPRVGGRRTMRAWSYVRGAAVNPVQGPIDFDQVAAAGAARMQLFINHAQLLVGAPAATVAAMAAVPDPIVIDPFHVQQQIWAHL